MKKLFTPQEVARLAGITGSRVRYWTRLGLVPHTRRPHKRLWFDFQGLVSLRTIKELREQGVSLHKIRACVEQLKKRHPEITEPLSQVRFAASPQRIVLAQKKRCFTPEGQLHLNFNGTAARIIPLAGADLGALFLQALNCEGRGDLEEAREKYDAILTLKRDHPDALVNMGNILYRWHHFEGAESHYRQALEANPTHVEANYNLANLLEEKGRLDEAVLYYQQALDLDPAFSEACLNMARTLEKQGKIDLARKYWRMYLNLEPGGEWADFLKNYLEDD